MNRNAAKNVLYAYFYVRPQRGVQRSSFLGQSHQYLAYFWKQALTTKVQYDPITHEDFS